MKENNDWPFNDPRNVAVFTNITIINSGAPILRVSHDKGDGAWQFLDGVSTNSYNNAYVVSLSEIVEIDNSILELSDLPLGWVAKRNDIDSPWVREKKLSDNEKLGKAKGITRIVNLLGAIQGVSLGFTLIIIVSFLPVVPLGGGDTKASFILTLLVYLKSELSIAIAVCLLLLFTISAFAKKFIKKKYDNYIY